MKRKVKLTSSARNKLSEINNYAQTLSEQYAIRLTKRLFDKAKSLESNTFDGRPIPEMADPFIRQLLLEQFRIIYRIISDQEVHVLTFWHSAKPLLPDEDIDFDY